MPPLGPLEFDDRDLPQRSGNGVSWWGFREVGPPITCLATDDALKALAAGKSDLTDKDRLDIFNKHRKLFERIASKKYDAIQITEGGEVAVTAADISAEHG